MTAMTTELYAKFIGNGQEEATKSFMSATTFCEE